MASGEQREGIVSFAPDIPSRQAREMLDKIPAVKYKVQGDIFNWQISTN
jgi:hypothetical protein